MLLLFHFAKFHVAIKKIISQKCQISECKNIAQKVKPTPLVSEPKLPFEILNFHRVVIKFTQFNNLKGITSKGFGKIL